MDGNLPDAPALCFERDDIAQLGPERAIGIALTAADGTLRCLAILLALRQRPTPAIVCIDEIEDSVHPAALGVLLDAVAASAGRCQVLLTSHSPEALSHPAVTAPHVRVVEWRDGRSDIYRLSPGAEEISRPPRSVGKLLRANALFTAERPDRVVGDFFEGE